MSISIEAWLRQATGMLTNAGISTARLDCLVLLEDELKRSRAHLLAHSEARITHTTEVKLNKKIAQRSRHVPLAYIRNKAPFYGREFTVNSHVLVPRPETEAMIELLKKLPLPDRPRIADIGTGSGCLGITAALETSNAEVHMYDVDKKALAVARQNAHNHSVQAVFYASNLLERYAGPYDVILANLPYVPDRYEVNQAAEYEPTIALFGGEDGLDLYRDLWRQLDTLRRKPAYILTEALPSQHGILSELAGIAGYRLVAAKGFIQQFAVNL